MGGEIVFDFSTTSTLEEKLKLLEREIKPYKKLKVTISGELSPTPEGPYKDHFIFFSHDSNCRHVFQCRNCSTIHQQEELENHIVCCHPELLKKKEEKEVKKKEYLLREKREDEDYHPEVKKALKDYSTLKPEDKAKVDKRVAKSLKANSKSKIYTSTKEEQPLTVPKEIHDKLISLTTNHYDAWMVYLKFQHGWEKPVGVNRAKIEWFRRRMVIVPDYQETSHGLAPGLPYQICGKGSHIGIWWTGTQGGTFIDFSNMRRATEDEIRAYHTKRILS